MKIERSKEIEYLVQKLEILLSEETGIWDNPNIEFIGSGLNGVVFFYQGFPNYAIKIPHDYDKSTDPNIFPDPIVLTKLQGSLNYPKLYAYQPASYMIVDRIFGKPYYGYNCIEINKQLSVAYDFAESNGYNVYDASGHNVIVQSNGIPVIVDVGGFQIQKEGVFNV